MAGRSPTLRIWAAIAAVFWVVTCPTQARAQAVDVAVGTFTSEKSCTVYELAWGRELAWANSSTIGSARAWGSELVRDCVNNFPGLRATVISALTSSGKFVVTSARSNRTLILTGKITDIGQETNSINNGGVTLNGDDIVVSVEYQLKDTAGRSRFGGSITKHFSISSTIDTVSGSSATEQSGRTVYSQTQRQVALAVARAVSFKLLPLQVVATDGKNIKLNYGAPLIELGGAAQVELDGSIVPIRLNVTSASDQSSVVTSEAQADLSRARVGTIVTYLEAEDARTNSTRRERVELPDS